MNILLGSDLAQTGFGRVGRELGTGRLAKGHDIRIIGINYRSVEGELAPGVARHRTQRGFRGAVAARFAEDFEKKAAAAADRQPRPMGTKAVGDARALRDWGLADPQVDPALFGEVLRTRGFTPEEASQMIVVRENDDDEELMAALTQPTQDEALIDLLTRIAEYPFRYAMVRGIDDPDEQVRFSDMMDTRWQGDIPANPQADGVVETQQAPDGAAPEMGGA